MHYSPVKGPNASQTSQGTAVHTGEKPTPLIVAQLGEAASTGKGLMQNIQCEACKALKVRDYIRVHCRYLLVFICQYTWQNAVYTCMYLYLYEEDKCASSMYASIHVCMYVSVLAHCALVY